MKRFEYIKRFLYLIILGGILGGFLAGCKGTPQKQAESENSAGTGKPTVTVTIPPYKYFVDKIAENKVDVNVMVSNGNNPENGTYVRCVHDLTPGEIVLIEKQGEK